MTLGSLFSGIGGFDLAAERCGIDVMWVSEINPYASAVLKTHFPNAPNLGDITQLHQPPPVDILCGGFPCQDISVAGKGAGITGERSGLWKDFARIIGEVRPQYVVIENSPNLRNKGLEVVLQDLWAFGYDAEWHCIPASAVGAPHQRDRIWIIAHSHTHSERRDGRGNYWYTGQVSLDAERNHSPSLQDRKESQPDSWSLGPFLADAIRTGLERFTRHGLSVRESRRNAAGSDGPVAAPCVFRGSCSEGWWLSEPNVGRVAHGVPSRVDRLTCLGNAIVPQIAEAIFSAIVRYNDSR